MTKLEGKLGDDPVTLLIYLDKPIAIHNKLHNTMLLYKKAKLTMETWETIYNHEWKPQVITLDQEAFRVKLTEFKVDLDWEIDETQKKEKKILLG